MYAAELSWLWGIFSKVWADLGNYSLKKLIHNNKYQGNGAIKHKNAVLTFKKKSNMVQLTSLRKYHHYHHRRHIWKFKRDGFKKCSPYLLIFTRISLKQCVSNKTCIQTRKSFFCQKKFIHSFLNDDTMTISTCTTLVLLHV